MAQKNDYRSIINKKIISAIHYVTKKSERVALFTQTANEAQKCGLKDLELSAEGYLYAINKKFTLAEEKLNQSLAINSDNPFTWISLGIAYSDIKDFKKAEVAYRKAIELDDKIAISWNGLGNIYSAQKENQGKSKDAYLKAIELNDKYAIPWFNLGNYYNRHKDYENGRTAFLKAIEIDDKYASPWNGIGNVYKGQNDFENAKKAYLKAIELDDQYAHALKNYGTLLIKDDLEGALTYFERALIQFKLDKVKFMVSVTENNIKSVVEKIAEERALRATAETKKIKDPLIRILSETRHFEAEVYENQKSFESFVEKSVSKEKGSSYLKVLRRWNSYTPIVADNYYISKGGGYFLKYEGKGIVIDPGFNFIDNFKGAGHLFDEIDIVMITHAHNDHTSDLESILTLLNNYNKKQKGNEDFESDSTIRADIARDNKCDIRSVKKEEIEKAFLGGSPRRKTLDIYFTKSVEKKFSGMFKLRSKEDYTCHGIENGDIKQLLDGSLQVSVIGAKHDDLISDRDSVGFVFDFTDSILVYTGDTGWNDKIEKQYMKIRDDHQGKYIVLLAHLGGFKENENKYATIGNKPEVYYSNHLGRLGLVRLVQVMRPNICFISEFGEELRLYREELAEIFERIFEGSTRFLPGDIGLEFHLKERKINAISLLNLEKNDCYLKLIEPANVRTCLLRKDYSLHYYDGKALFKPTDLIQILGLKFDRSSLKPSHPSQ